MVYMQAPTSYASFAKIPYKCPQYNKKERRVDVKAKKELFNNND